MLREFPLFLSGVFELPQLRHTMRAPLSRLRIRLDSLANASAAFFSLGDGVGAFSLAGGPPLGAVVVAVVVAATFLAAAALVAAATAACSQTMPCQPMLHTGLSPLRVARGDASDAGGEQQSVATPHAAKV